MTYLLLGITVFLALGTTGLFFYGGWLLLTGANASEQVRKIAHALRFVRHSANPLIAPNGLPWEADGTLNPAVVDVDGDLHLFYRAVGSDGISRVGYASSKTGDSFARLPYPVFSLLAEHPDTKKLRSEKLAAFEALVASGGSWAGVEDPRAVVIDGRLYITFSAFGGWDSLRMGVSSLSLDDLSRKRWKWTPPVYISPRSQVHKNWVLFPEKINGKFAILHSLHGDAESDVRITYMDSLDEEPTETVESVDPNALPDNPLSWHKRVRGAGPPPIRTEHGWLVLYHAIDAEGPSHYKLGAMLLDLKDPTKVLHRGIAPILAPSEPYENTGVKPGIVYACGTSLRGDELTVYYGAADSVICSAKHSLSELLDLLMAQPGEVTIPLGPTRTIPVMGAPHLL